jgi:alanyl-tRNA synthetase
MRAHTATHLLHAALTNIFPQTKQAGSYVGPDELRFDFFAERLLTSEELQQIVSQINTSITANLPVSVAEMSYDDAIKTGAKAFFEDTYPEVVRVVSIMKNEE